MRVKIFRWIIPVSFLYLFFWSTELHSQSWLRNIENPGKGVQNREDFLELKDAFENYWSTKTDQRGQGYKPFKRWEWMMDSRLLSGKDRNTALWEAYIEKLTSKNSQDGNWVSRPIGTPPLDIRSGYPVGNGRIDCIEFHPTNPLIFFVGSPTGGLWKTIDGGATWATLTDNLPVIGISDIAIHPQHPDTIFIATGDRDAGEVYSIGVMKSTDGGITWNTTGLSFNLTAKNIVNRLLIRPDQPDTLIAATRNGIYLLSEGGATIRQVYPGHFKDLEFRPGFPREIYAASYSYGYSSVYKSTDGGLTFQESFGTIDNQQIRRIELAVTEAAPDNVYALCANKEDSGFEGLYISRDSGVVWQAFTNTSLNLLGTNPDGSSTGGQGWYDLSLAVAPDDENKVFVGGINIWKTIGGTVWNIVSYGYPEFVGSSIPYVHVDQHILEHSPLTGELYSGNDGGLSKTVNNGASWTDLSEGLEITQIYRIGLSATQPNLYLMGTQDNSTIRYKQNEHLVVKGADGMECIIDYSDTNIMYASSQRGNLERSFSGGFSFDPIKPNSNDAGAWVTPYVMHPYNPNIILAGYSSLYRTDNQGNDWTNLTSNLTGDIKLTSIAMAPSDPKYMYISTNKNIWKTVDNGSSWTQITTGIPLASSVITSIAVSEYDPMKIWVALSNYNYSNKVFTSDDGGMNWNNYSDGLPNVPANCIIIEKDRNGALYVGTDLGVYFRNRDLDTWINFNNGLPNVIVNELEIYYPQSKIRAATYGRGLWESDLYTPVIPPLYAEFSKTRSEICDEGTITLVSHSSASDSLEWILSGSSNVVYSATRDTAFATYTQTGLKDIGLIAFRNGTSDTLIRNGYILVDSSIELYLESISAYFWRGDTTLLIASGGDNYQWSPSEGLQQTTNGVIKVSPDTTTRYYVTATDGLCTVTDSIDLIVHQNNLIRFATPLSLGENGPFLNNQATIASNEPHPPAGECVSQTEWCDEWGTGTDILANSVWFTLEGPPLGVASFETTGFDAQIAVYDAVNADSILNGKYTILAANDDKSTQDFNAGIQRIENLIPGKTYWVQVDGSGGNKQGSFSLFYYNTALGIDPGPEEVSGPEMLIYPNPSPGSFHLRIQSGSFSDGTLTIYNLQGKIVYSDKFPLNIGSFETEIQLPQPVPGIYLVKVVTQNWTRVEKVQIQ